LKPVPLDDTGNRTVSLAFVFLLSCGALFGWDWAVLAATVCMAASQLVEHVVLPRAAFNTSVYALSAFVAALPAYVLHWYGVTLPDGASAMLAGLVFLGGALFVLTNVVLIATAVALHNRSPLRSMLDDYVRHAGPA